MSALTLFKGGQLPTYLKAGLDDTTKALMGSGSSGKRISIKGSVFRMFSGSEEVGICEDRAMNIVIVAAAPNVSRTFYEGVYSEGATAGPVCWSADGVVPSDLSEKKQSPTCALCPQNIKGSGQGESKACRYSRKLAVVLGHDLEGDVYQMTLPSTSIFGKGEPDKLPLEAYVRYLASHNVPVTAVTTEMRFDTKVATPKLTFRAVEGLSEEAWEICRMKGETQEAKDAIVTSFQPSKKKESIDQVIEQKIAITNAGAVLAKPKAKPLVEAIVDVVDLEPAKAVEAEPVKVATKKATAAATPEMTALLDEWEQS